MFAVAPRTARDLANIRHFAYDVEAVVQPVAAAVVDRAEMREQALHVRHLKLRRDLRGHRSKQLRHAEGPAIAGSGVLPVAVRGGQRIREGVGAVAHVGIDIVQPQTVDLCDLVERCRREPLHYRVHHFRAVHQLDVAVFHPHPLGDEVPEPEVQDEALHPHGGNTVKHVLRERDDCRFSGAVNTDHRRFDLFHVFRGAELVDVALRHHAVRDVRAHQRFMFGVETVAGVADGAGEQYIRIQHHIHGQPLPLIYLRAQMPLHAAEIRVRHRAFEETVNVQLIPRHLIDRDHGLQHRAVVQRAPQLPLLAVPVAIRVFHVPLSQRAQRQAVFGAQFHIGLLY